MKSFGYVLVLAGIVGFLVCGKKLDTLPPVPEGVSIEESLKFYETPRWEIGRYASVAGFAIGVILALLPSGRA